MLNTYDFRSTIENPTQKIVINLRGLPCLNTVTVIKGFDEEFDVLSLISQVEAERERKKTFDDMELDSKWQCIANCLITDKWGHSYIWKEGTVFNFLEVDSTQTCYKVRLYSNVVEPDVFIEEQEYWYSMPLEQFKLVAKKVQV